mmetsp:Transcript_28810/g.84999  ORF Transcript_28810/g.84999 Transcript_28810/m.84999 type:complete len:577 (-) Transcript_28810:537-2267(-)
MVQVRVGIFLLICQRVAGFSTKQGAACHSPLFVRNPRPVTSCARAVSATDVGNENVIVNGERRIAEKEAREYTPPSFHKAPEEESVLRETLGTSFIFGDLSEKALNELIQAFFKVEVPEGTTIIRQGSGDAEYMYVLMKGDCEITVDNKVLPGIAGRTAQGSMIGELGLLYNKARADTVTATTDVTLFQLNREAFQYFINSKQESEPEWTKNELEQIDEAIDKIAGIKSRYKEGTIIRDFNPRRRWLWFRWTGTVVQHAWKGAVWNMLLSVATIATIHSIVDRTWISGTAPDVSAHPLIARFDTFNKVWQYLMNITTFILTFFLSQAYNLWRRIYSDARKIQGRLNDLGLLIASAAKHRDVDGKYEVKTVALLDDVALYSRLFHTFVWARFAKKYSILLTSRGMRRMVNRGLMTARQYNALKGLDSSVGTHNAILEWITIRMVRGMKDGSLEDDGSLKLVIYDKVCELRGTAAGVGDALDGRMPLAYAHFVQILVDTFLITAPFALYAELGAWSVLAVGILTLFYSGLLDLAKIFLDPLDNDNFYKESVNMDVGVLIREGNAGSTRWKLGAEDLPF